MKKLLSVVLSATVLLTVFGVATIAAPIDHSLQFELPVVTAIEAEWTGEILLHWDLHPQFTPNNVAVTAHFDDGTYEVLTEWDGFFSGGNRWVEWHIFAWLNPETNLVTVSYFDSRLRDEWVDDAGCCCDVNWNDFNASLPQTTFEFPEYFVEVFMQDHAPFAVLELGEDAVMFTDTHVFTFTAPESRAYRFGFNQGWGRIIVLDAQHNFVAGGSSSTQVELQAGATYYIIATQTEHWGDDARIFVTTELQQQWRPTLYSRWRNWANNVMWNLDGSVFGRIVLVLLAPFHWAITGVVSVLSWIIHGRWW